MVLTELFAWKGLVIDIFIHFSLQKKRKMVIFKGKTAQVAVNTGADAFVKCGRSNAVIQFTPGVKLY